MMKRWMAVLGIVFLCSPVVRAEDPVYFADDNLKGLVENQLGKKNPTPSDMLDLNSLMAPWRDITDLTGLEYAANLTDLELGENQISDLSPLAGLTNLTNLALYSNQISDLSPLAGLTNLTLLGLSFNQISDLSPLAGLTNLGVLNLYANQISDISPLAELTNLTDLRLGANPLNPAACNVYIPQIISNNPGIDISYDPCPEDPVYFADTNLKAAVEAHLNKTNPTPTDMLGLTSFTPPSSPDITDLTGLEYATNLTLVELGSNQISDISPLAGLTNLRVLNLYGNQISDISPLAGLTNLGSLDLTHNQISDLSPLAGLTNLTYLRLVANPLNPAACNVHIPQIISNNPGIDIYCDPCIEAAVPRVVGMTQAEAEAAVIAAGFKVGTVWCGPSDLPEGTVYTQDPAGGAMAPPGSAVDLTVSQADSGPILPGAGDPNLLAWWKMDETSGDVVFDSAGQNDGVTYGQPLWQPTGGQLDGALQFDGVDDYAQLPLGPVLGALTDSTFATWVNWSGGPDGQRIFDFGGGPIHMFLTPCAAGVGRMRFVITEAGTRSQNQATAPQALATGWHHVAVTIDAADQTYVLYLDGQVVATKTDAQYTPSSLGDTTQNWLGRSRSSADPYFHGSLDDFRIYGCALSAAEVAQLAAGAAGYPILLLDFSNNKVATQTEAGFTSFTLADSGSTIDGITVELAGSLEARWRGAPTGIPYELVYRDFIFARPGGMTVTLSGLTPNAAYEITIYAYDTGSTAGGDRIADWTANGEFCLTAGFTASLAPVAAEDYAFTGMAQADGTGKIVLAAGPNVNTTEQSGATNPFAFLNALVISSRSR